MSTTKQKALFPKKKIRVSLLMHEVDGRKKTMVGTFRMETMPDFEFWFAWNRKYRMPTFGALDKSDKLNDRVKAAARKRVARAVVALSEHLGRLSKADPEQWYSLTLEEDDFFATAID
jgi:hypothetical protein